VPDAPPETVAAAVRRAASGAHHLVFTDAAYESAADSPYRRPGDVLDTLTRLDELAGLYADPDGFGRSLGQAAEQLGLTWRQSVSELARSRNRHAYTVTYDGERLELGPHVALGSGSGAGFIARIYLHVADGSGDVPRGLYVGHVARGGVVRPRQPTTLRSSCTTENAHELHIRDRGRRDGRRQGRRDAAGGGLRRRRRPHRRRARAAL
jgi:hypothetical protein